MGGSHVKMFIYSEHKDYMWDITFRSSVYRKPCVSYVILFLELLVN